MDIKTVLTSVAASVAAVAITVPPMVSFVTLQASSPGVKETGNTNISGNSLAANFGAGITPSLARVEVQETGVLQGVRSTTNGAAAIYGKNNSASGATFGGLFYTNGTTGSAVFGESLSTSGISVGGQFRSRSTDGIGVYGRNLSATGSTVGVRGQVASSDGTAGKFKNDVSGMEALLGGKLVAVSGDVDSTDPAAIAVSGTAHGFGAAGSFADSTTGNTVRLCETTDAINATSVPPVQGGGVNNSFRGATTTDTIRTAGVLPRHDYQVDTPITMVPIAYGYVSGTTVISGTGNFTVAAPAAGHYDINIQGLSAGSTQFSVVACPVQDAGNQTATVSAAALGDFRINIFDVTTGLLTTSDFTFVAYRVAGLGALGMPENLNNPTALRTYGDTEKWAKADPRGYAKWLADTKAWESRRQAKGGKVPVSGPN